MAKTEEFMFSNVAYRAVYRTGASATEKLQMSLIEKLHKVSARTRDVKITRMLS